MDKKEWEIRQRRQEIIFQTALKDLETEKMALEMTEHIVILFQKYQFSHKMGTRVSELIAISCCEKFDVDKEGHITMDMDVEPAKRMMDS